MVAQEVLSFHVFLVVFFVRILTVQGQADCECGLSTPTVDAETRIINGEVTLPHQYPWMVYLRRNGDFFCGGAIINDRFILTAAHCLYRVKRTSILSVVVGGHNVVYDDGYEYIAKDFRIHENYTRYEDNDDNDIGLVELKATLRFNDKIRPICFPDPDFDYEGKTMVIAGWGSMVPGQLIQGEYLMHAFVKLLPQNECETDEKIGDRFVAKENVCAFRRNKDTCQGDSGSPMFYESSSKKYKYEIIGVVSWGEGCAAGSPSVYVKVANYLDWIYDNTKGATYCRN